MDGTGQQRGQADPSPLLLSQAETWSEAGLALEGCDDDALFWRFSGLDTVERLLVDGVALSEDRWSVAPTQQRLRVAVEPWFHDALPHAIEMVGRYRGRPARLATRHRAAYRGTLEAVEDGFLRGWIHDAACPGRRVRLTVEFDDLAVFGDSRVGTTAGEPRPDLEGPASEAGFHLAWKPGQGAVALRVHDTGLLPFGLIDRAAAGREAGSPLYRRLGPVRVAVVIVVPAGADAVPACLDGLHASADRIGHEVIVVEDEAVDAQLPRALAAAAAAGGFTYLRHAGAGRLACLRAGIALRPDHDVVLLDATAEVPPGWLDRLYRVATSDPTIASVVPLGGPAMDAAAAEIDLLCRTLNAGVVRDAPMAGAACTYLRRAALNAFGPFALAAFGDLASRGWRHVVAADVWMGQGSTAGCFAADGLAADGSARDGSEAYSSEADKSGDLGHRLQIALWRARGPSVVLVTHALPGGTGRHVDRLAHDLAASGRLVLLLRSDGPHRLVLRPAAPADHGDQDLRYDGSLRYDGVEAACEAMADIFALAPEFVHVHHFIDLPDTVEVLLRGAGIPYVVTLHDYFFGCPRVTLLDEGGTFCGAPAVEHCAPCLAAAEQGGAGLHDALHPSLAPLARRGETWRAKWEKLLAGARQVMAPSAAAAHYVGRMFPGLRIDVRPHTAVEGGSLPGTLPDLARAKPWRIAVIGRIGRHKGSERLHELVRHCQRREPDLRFIVVGDTDRDEALRRYLNVEILGAYEPGGAIAAITAARCATALFLSIWPETYCFALSDALLAGLAPVALDMGAIGERLRARAPDALVSADASPDVIVAALRAAAEREAAAPEPVDRSYEALFGDYYDAPLDEQPPAAPVAIGTTSGIFSDLWCGRRFDVALLSRLDLQAVELTVWTPSGHLSQRAQAWIGVQAPVSAWLEAGGTTTLILPVSDGCATLHRIRVVADFETSLAPPDRRRAAARLVGLRLVTRQGERLAYGVAGTDDGAGTEISLIAT